MTLAEYMSAEKFPLTSQKGLSPSGQLFIDAVNYDQMKEAIEDGLEMTDRQKARWAELQGKAKHAARLTAELRAAEKAEKK